MDAADEKLSYRCKILTVLGAIDCKHVEIQEPKNYGGCNVNKKRYASISFELLINATYKFTRVNASFL